MGFYAQQNYPQHLGGSNSVTIAEAGCLLTSVSNGLLKMTGSAPDPLTLNQFFLGHGAFVWDAADQANDDLTWGSISIYDPTIRLTKVGVGSLPDSSNAIVKFHYTGVHSGQPIDHYCWVDHIEGRDVFIIDSWDGLIKGPSGYQGVYHLPVGWATFERVSVAAPPPPSPKFTVTETYPQGRQIRLNKQPTHLWGMNYDFNYMKDHAVETHNQGEVWTVTNKVHHIDGYDYYRRDGQVDGFNVADCDDYTPPPPPPPVPQVINTPNVPVPKVERYPVVKKLMVFATAEDAKGRRNYTGEDIEPDTYIVIQKDEHAYLLSKDNNTDIGWVNTYDNVIKPVEVLQPTVQPTLPTDAPATDINLPVDLPPAPITDVSNPLPTGPKPQYNWIRADMLPVRLTSTNSTVIKITDLEGKWPTQDFPAHHTEDYSMFAVINGTEYWLPDKTRKKGYMYGLSVAFLPEEQPIKPTVMDRNANGKYDIQDIFDTGLGNFIEFTSRGYQTIHDVMKPLAPKVAPATKRIKQSIDGFKKRKP